MQQERLALLQSMPIFGGLNETGLDFLSGLFKEVSVSKNAYFFNEGDSANSLFILESGQAQMLKRDHHQGESLILRTLERGDCFGEMSLIDPNPRSASVIATADCLAIELSNQALFQLYEAHMDQFTLIQMNMLREVSRRLRDLDERLSELDSDLLPILQPS